MRTGSRTFAEPARRELLRMHARWDAERAAENKRTGFGGALAHAKGGVYTDIDVARREKWIEKHRADALMERAFHENNKKRIKDGKIENYQVVTPTAWNIGPQDGREVHGPMEQAFIGTEIKDMEDPVELGHVARSYDSCLVCTVHAYDKKSGKQLTKFQVNNFC